MADDEAAASRRQRRTASARVVCAVCGKEVPAQRATPVALLRPPLQARLHADHPDLPADAMICHDDLALLRAGYVTQILNKERGDLSQLEQEVVQSLSRQDTLARDIEAEWDQRRSFGEAASDRIASFGGSWPFIGIFFAILAIWMLYNLMTVGRGRFDPYPFILLNLALSCLAAIQAPIIMMSQSRQEAKDRLRSENDFQVNLKAELEIRNLHDKVDHLLKHQWEHLAEIQEVQLEMLRDLVDRPRK